MKDKIFGVLQRVGRSFMLPIAILPIAGLFLGIGGSFTNETMLRSFGLYEAMGPGTVANTILSVLNSAGNIVFANLPLLFAMGVAIGMAKKEKEVAALASAIAFLIMHVAVGTLICVNYGGGASVNVFDSTAAAALESAKGLSGATANVLGIYSLNMGVFGGVIVGLGVAALHNKFYKIQLPQVLSFFGGTRFVPIISSAVFLLVGILMYFIWQPIQSVISAIGDFVQKSNYIGTFIYGVAERALIPFGLHHVFYMPFWQTNVGGSLEVMGKLVEGAQNIFFAQLSDPSVNHFAVSATRFMSGKFPLMIFGLPGAALAMYKCARTEKKKVVGSLLLSAALTSMLTGITEPLEFTFLFVAPVLYVIHCVFAGLAYMLMHILNVGVGMTFSGGIIDLILFGVLQGNAKTDWIRIVFVGIGYFAVYYFLFSFLIKKFNFKTPGREADNEETKLYTRADVNARKAAQGAGLSPDDEVSALILHGLGGKANLSDVDCCATRLRVTVKDPGKVSEAVLKQSGAAGVIKKGNGIQVIYGPRVTVIKSNLEDFIASPLSDIDMSPEAPAESKPESAPEKPAAQAPSGPAIDIYAPLTGKVVPLEKVEDDVFSAGILGQGVAIEPSEGKVFSPVDGTIAQVFDTKHAIAITGDHGEDLLIHVGLDTVKLEGKYFEVHVKDGDEVKKGDLLTTFDIDGITSAGYKTTTPLIVCNSENYGEINIIADKEIKAGDKAIELRK